MLGGLQLMATGILGEYIGRMFIESKNRPLYLIDEFRPSRVGFTPSMRACGLPTSNRTTPIARLAATTRNAAPMTPEASAVFLKTEQARYERLVKKANIVLD